VVELQIGEWEIGKAKDLSALLRKIELQEIWWQGVGRIQVARY
jgi:hypothetical protein